MLSSTVAIRFGIPLVACALGAAQAEGASIADPELLAAAERLYQHVVAGADVEPAPPAFHPLYVPRDEIRRREGPAAVPVWAPPLRVWPERAREEDPDVLRRKNADMPAPELFRAAVDAALAAPGELPPMARTERRPIRSPLDAYLGAEPDEWLPLFFDIETPDRNYAGRVTQVRRAHDPAQGANVLWAGTVGGGLYKVLLFPPFAFWVPVSYSLPGSPSVGAFLVRPSNGTEILIGTGDSQRAVPGTGLYKSVDGGATWQRRPLPAESSALFRLRSHVTLDERVLLASGAGLFLSLNFGDTWTTVLTGAPVTDVIQDPVFPSYWYAAVRNQGILESSDGGASFHPFDAECSGIPGPFGRTELAISPSAPNYVFAVVEDQSGGLNGIYRSPDYGCNWTAIDPLDTNSWGQAFHAIAIAVDPTTPSRLFVGMGGAQWTGNATAASPCWVRNIGDDGNCGLELGIDAGHVDMTDFLFDGASTVLIANDGGLFTYNWTSNEIEDLGNELGFVTLQTMSTVQTLTSAWLNPDLLLAGLQDNGMAKIVNSNGISLRGGDGGVVSYSPDDSDELYFGNGLPYRRWGSHTGGDALFSLECGLPVNGFGGHFQDPTPNRPASSVFLFTMAPDTAGDPFVWYKPPTSTCNWAKAHTAPLPFLPVAVDQNNDLSAFTLYAWSGGNYRLMVSSGNPGSMTWSDRTPPGVDPQGPDMRFFADRSTGRASTGYYTSGNSSPARAFVTHSKGLTWDDVTGSLPYVTAGARLLEMAGDPGDLDTLFIATEVGVFRTDTARAAFPIWYRYMEGLPAVTLTYNLDVRKVGASPGVIRIGTYGHGFWEREIGPTSFLFADDFEAGSTIAWSDTNP